METFRVSNHPGALWLAAALLVGVTFAIESRAQAPAPLSERILESVRPDSKLEVFYLGAPDCPYCIQWERKARGELLAWTGGMSIGFVEIRGETLRAPITDRHYPPQYRWVYEQLGPSRGVPRFLLAIDGKLKLSTLGVNRYEEVFFPILKEVAARRANPQ
jgi:hypothetical protein